MIDTSAIDAWMTSYLTAWNTDAPADIGALFEPDAQYYTAPFRTPHTGRERIVEWWVGQENSAIPWSFEYEVIAREGMLYVVKGVTTYPEGFEPGDDLQVFDNIWLVTLAPSGAAIEFVEYWMLRA